MLKIVQLLGGVLSFVVAKVPGNIHKLDAAIDKAHEAWKGVYGFLSHLSPADKAAVNDAAPGFLTSPAVNEDPAPPPRPSVAL